jgi:hypothetical protein
LISKPVVILVSFNQCFHQCFIIGELCCSNSTDVCGCYLVQFFNLLQLLPISLTHQNVGCIRKSTMKHEQNLDWKLDLPLFCNDYWNCMFVDFF